MNVVFDVGGVLLRWEPLDFMPRLLPGRTGTAAATEALVRDFFQGFDGDWADFDRGSVEPDALAERIARRTGLSVAEAALVIAAIPAELLPLDASVALLRRLHARGHALHFLSNMPAPYAAHLEATLDFLGLFRSGVFSARIRLIKPEAAIFDHAGRAFDIVDPARTLFIDDVLRNVEAARKAGWQAFRFENPAQCAAELTRRGLI